ncbi:hypothetical protein COO60DRAFT_7375 [Scenedesmus sp. NREL 46B-D3]|nr:hypothetical protein COO60DRAFT_7375 [Scenedesmus sp. NREL 46B-D3]
MTCCLLLLLLLLDVLRRCWRWLRGEQSALVWPNTSFVTTAQSATAAAARLYNVQAQQSVLLAPLLQWLRCCVQSTLIAGMGCRGSLLHWAAAACGDVQRSCSTAVPQHVRANSWPQTTSARLSAE